MKQNSLILTLLLVASALLTYSGTTVPDLIVSPVTDGSYVMVREPVESYGRAFYSQKNDPGFVGTWSYSLSTKDYPSSQVITHTLTLNPDGTASLVVESKNRVPQAQTLQYRTATETRKGNWCLRGDEVWVDLEDIV